MLVGSMGLEAYCLGELAPAGLQLLQEGVLRAI